MPDKKPSRFLKLVVALGVLIATIAISTVAFAAGPTSVSSIASNLGTSLHGLSLVLESIATVAGIGFILVSFFKFHQHKQQPTQVPLSQGLVLLVIGAGLTLFPRLIETPGTAILGASASATKINSSAITTLLGTGK